MTRRMFLWVMAAAGIVLRGGGSILSAQDVQYARAMDRAQKDRPARLGAGARIAPTSEPGDPVIVRGRLRNLNGAAAAGAIVFAYHTDREGLYDDRSRGPHSWLAARLGTHR
jgi:protocatechuate 3,4-dioxygenase beta subunit